MKTRYYILTLIALFLCNIAVSAQERNPNRLILHKGNTVLKTYSVDQLNDITFDYVENKEVKINVLSVSEDSCKVKFTMPDNCESYLVGAIPVDSNEDLEEYLLKKQSVKFTESTEYVFKNLRAGVEYYILALPIDKYGLSTVLSKEKVKTVSFVYVDEESKFFDVDYWGDYASLGYQNFVIRLGDCPHEGIHPRGNGKIYSFSIHCKTTDGTTEIMPKAGTYTYYIDGDPTDMTMDGQCEFDKYSDYKSENDYVGEGMKFNQSTLTIEKNADGTYTLLAKIQLQNGDCVAVHYTGPCSSYRDKTFKGYEGPNLDHDIEFTCDYASPYDLDGLCFEIMDGGYPYAEGASWYKRNRIMIFLDDDGHGMPRIGTFPVTEDGANGTVAKGYYKIMGAGVYGQVGTCYQYLDNPGVYATFGFVNSGSITISKDDATGHYTIATDFVTDKGKSIKATYTGPFLSNGKTAPKKQCVERVSPLTK